MPSKLPSGFTYLTDVDPSILQDIKYATNDNFIGRPINGYNAPIAIMTIAAATQLSKAQEDLKTNNLSLKVFDAYRPQSACDHFWQWANNPEDIINKQDYYPTFDDKTLLFNGYIARYSKHSRGSAIDLTIIDNTTKAELDMGGKFDFFGDISSTNSQNISNVAKDNRKLLQKIMEKNGFQNYHAEWWHYELIDEPFTKKPEDHFNFSVE